MSPVPVDSTDAAMRSTAEASESYAMDRDASNSRSAEKARTDESEDAHENLEVERLIRGDSTASGVGQTTAAQAASALEGSALGSPADSSTPLYAMPAVGERFPSVEAIRVAGSYASHRLGYRLALYSHPLRRSDGSRPPFQLVCNHGRHLQNKAALCPATITCVGVGTNDWKVESAILTHSHPPKFGGPWKAPRSQGPKQRSVPVAVMPATAKPEFPADGSEYPKSAMEVDLLSPSPHSQPSRSELLASTELGEDGLPQYLTSNENFTQEPLLPIPAALTVFPSRDALQNAIFRAYHQRGYHVTVFQSPVAGTKRLLGLGCSRRMKPFCPFRLFAGPVDVNSTAAGFRVAEISWTHNHLPRDQGPWVPRKLPGKRKRKVSSVGGDSRNASPDEEGEDDDGEEEIDAEYAGPSKVARLSTASDAPPLLTRASGGSPARSPLGRSNAATESSNASYNAPPLLYFNQPPSQPHHSQSPHPPKFSQPSATQSGSIPSYPGHANGFASSSSNPFSKPFATALAEWTTFLARLDPTLTHLAEHLASPALGCTPSSFFGNGTDDEIRMKLLERVEGIALWPRMVLMERVATSGAKVWAEVERASP